MNRTKNYIASIVSDNYALMKHKLEMKPALEIHTQATASLHMRENFKGFD